MSCTQTALNPGRPSHRRRLYSADADFRFPGTALRRFAHTVALWFERGRQRHDLAALDDHLLKDIGVTPRQAGREAAKPFWRE